MNALPAIERLGWVLVHSLWQFALVALLAGIVVRALRRKSAALRYGALVWVMAISTVVPVATWMMLPPDSIPIAASADLPTDAVVEPLPDAEPIVAQLYVQQLELPAVPMPEMVAASIPMELPPEDMPAIPDEVPADTAPWTEQAAMALRPWLLPIVAGWMIGVVLCAFRPLLGWRMLRRFKRVGTSPVSDDVQAALRRMSARLGVKRTVQVLQSTLTGVPIVVGYLRPVILLPVSLVTSLPPGQLEAILAHELAHVRRHDFVVNLLQTLIETLFFYHPAIWWMSRRIRLEREHCCDDLVVAALGNRVEYGRALLAIEEFRGRNTVLALGAADGSLLSRIQRLAGFGADRAAGGFLDRWTPILVCVACLGVVAAIGMNWTQSAANRTEDEPPATIGRLPGGIEVELLGVGFHPSKNLAWWKPDGGELSEQPKLSGGMVVMGGSPEQVKCREFLIHIRGLPSDHSIWTDYGANSASGGVFSNGLYVGEHAAGPFQKETTSIRIGLATEAYGPFVTIDANGQKPANAGIPAELQRFYDRIVPVGVEDVNGRTELLVKDAPLKDFRKEVAWELFAVDADGNKHRNSSQAGSVSAAFRFGFNLPLQKLAGFEYRLRPYRHWVTFEKVSLEPGRKSEFHASAASPTPLIDDRFVATLPDGIKVAFAGLAPMETAPQEWWRPDGSRMTTIPILGPNQQGLYQTGSDRTCRAIVEVTGVDDRQAVTGLGGLYDVSHRPSGEAFVTVTGALSVPPGNPQATVTIRVATEPISPTRILNAQGERQPAPPDAPADPIAEDITVLKVAPLDGGFKEVGGVRVPVPQTEVTWQVPLAWWQPNLRMVAIDKNGQTHQSSGGGGRIPEGSSGIHHGMVFFPLPPAQIERFEYQFRLYRHAVTFENVSLQPGKRTDVKISVESQSKPDSDAELLADRFLAAIRQQNIPYLDEAKLQELARNLQRSIAAHIRQPLSPVRREALAAAIAAVVRREFDPTEKDYLYLDFRNRYETLIWEIGRVLERPELTPEQLAEREVQRSWMRAEIEALPESAKFRLSHKEELGKLQALFDDPLNPFFQEPMSDEDFAKFQALYAEKMGRDRSDTRLISACTRLFQAVYEVLRDELLRQSPVENVGSQQFNLRWSLIVARQTGNSSLHLNDRQREVRDIYADVMQMIFVPGDAPADRSAHGAWLEQQGHGDLAFDAQADALVGVRGARLAVLDAHEWFSADQVPLSDLRKLVERDGTDSVPMLKFMEIDGDPANGIRHRRAAMPSLVVQTQEGRIAVIRLFTVAGVHPVIMSHPRPLPPNPPLHAGDVAEPDKAESPPADGAKGDSRQDRETGAAAAKPAAAEPEWGAAQNGLRCRLLPVSPDSFDEEPELARKLNRFARGDDVTFAVELQNVSEARISLLGVRRTTGFSELDGGLDASRFGPHLFEFQFRDAAGKPIARPARVLLATQPRILGSASVHNLAPHESLLVLLRPARFYRPLGDDLPPGNYVATVIYRGPTEETLADFREKRRDFVRGNAWSHSTASNEVAFAVDRESSPRHPREPAWGPVQDGLQAALAFGARPDDRPTFDPPGTWPVEPKVETLLLVRNVSDRVIRFVCEASRQLDEVTVTDEAGKSKRLDPGKRLGLMPMVRWTLNPGETAELPLSSRGISQLDQPGKYTLRYRCNFGEFGQKALAGEPEFPLPDDWRQTLVTGETPVAIRARTPADEAQKVLPAEAEQKVSPSVVDIQVKKPDPRGAPRTFSGLGLVVDERGYILTTNRLISGGDADNIRVSANEPRQHLAKLVRTSPQHDLALLKIERKLPVAPLGTSADVKVGDPALVFYAGREAVQVTVSGTNREVRVDETLRLKGLLQTESAFDFGLNAGPLLTPAGEVIGINVASRTSTKRLGLVLPIDAIRPVLAELLRKALAAEGEPPQNEDAEPERSSDSRTSAVPPAEPVQSRVIDKATGEPIEGATVRFRFRKIRRDPGEPDDLVGETVYRDVGRFTFTVPEQVKGLSNLFVERTAEHPNYQTMRPSMVSLKQALDGDQAFARNFIREVEMSPGVAVTGRVLDLDGRPAQGIPITSGRSRRGWENGCEHQTLTDADGRFRLVVPTDHGRGRIYVIPDHAAAVSRAITPDHGEQEVYHLRRGTRIHGKVLDLEKQGVEGVVVRANGGERIPWRYAITDAQGRYSLPPCQYGDYRVELLDGGVFPEMKQQGIRLPDVYVAQAVSLPKDAPREHLLDFQPVESVQLTAQFAETDGTPVRNSPLIFSGGLNGLPWQRTFHEIPDEPGRYQLRVPRGLQTARIENWLSDPFFLRIVRQSPDSGETSENWFVRIEADDDSLQIRRLKPARVTLRATLDGEPFDLTALKRNGPWPQFASEEEARRLGAGSATGHGLHHGNDGTLRTNVHPEIEMVVKFEGPGFRTQQKFFHLNEGEERIIDVELQSVDDEPNPPAAIKEVRPQPKQEIIAANPKTSLRISGRVLDAETGEPIANCRMIPTSVHGDNGDQVTWQSQYLRKFTDGRYLYETDRPWDKMKLRIEADGYRPAATRIIHQGEQAAAIDVKLVREVFKGVVRLPNGEPAAKAQLAIASWTNEVTVKSDQLSYGSHAEGLGRKVVETDDEGRFELPAEIDPSVIVAAHKAGYAEVTAIESAAAIKARQEQEPDEEKPRNNQAIEITLQPWGRVEGRLLVQDKPVASAKYWVYQARSDEVFVRSMNDVTTDAEGRFTIEKIPPGPHGICQRSVDGSEGTSSYAISGVLVRFEIPAGRTTTLELGRPGPPLVGRLALPEGFPHKVDWTKVRLRVFRDIGSSWKWDDDGARQAAAKFDESEEGRLYSRKDIAAKADGTFQIEGLPPADYHLWASASGEAAITDPKPEGDLLFGMQKFRMDLINPADPVAATDLGIFTLKTRAIVGDADAGTKDKAPPAPPDKGAEGAKSESGRSGLAPGRYTGAAQVMRIGPDGGIDYAPGLVICHMAVFEDDRVQVAFRNENQIWTDVTLPLATPRPPREGEKPSRDSWSAEIDDHVYRATAIPFSPNAYVFRLEKRLDGKLIEGSQQFFAIPPERAPDERREFRVDQSGSGLVPGRYTGARQVMQIDDEGQITYSDRPQGICHIAVLEDDRLEAAFPDKRGIPASVILPLATTRGHGRRASWSAEIDGHTCRATAVPYSSNVYVFRLEKLLDGKLIEGSQEFYAIEQKLQRVEPEDERNSRNESESGEKVDVFARKVSLAANALPLNEALDKLAHAAQLELRLDTEALKAAELDVAQPVTATIENETLNDALLRLIDWNDYPGVYRELRGETLVITTVAAAQERTKRALPDWLQGVYGRGLLATVDDDNQIVSITAGDALTDDLLAQFQTLPGLRELSVGGTTKLTADGLAALAGLTKLEKLSLASIDQTAEGLGDAALQHIVGLKSLRELSLNECGTTDDGIRLLEELPQLTRLDIYQEGRLTDAAIASIAKLTRLKSLGLNSFVRTERLGLMQFSSDAMQALAGLQELEHLHLTGQGIVAETLQFPRLKSLTLGGAEVDNSCAERIAACRDLRSLSLHFTGIDDAGLHSFADLQELRQLELGSRVITDAGIAHLTRLPRLQHISLRAPRLTDGALEHLAEMKTLTRIDLDGGEFSIAGVRQFTALPNLRTLWLSNFISSGSYLDLTELSQLRELTLMMANIREDEFRTLEEELPRTRIIHMTGGGGFSTTPRKNRR